jgi:hypothetical protein
MKHALEMYVKAKPITSETHLWKKKSEYYDDHINS